MALCKQERVYHDSEFSVRIDFIITIIVGMRVLKGNVHGQIRESIRRDKIFISKRVHKMHLKGSGLIGNIQGG